MTLKPTQQKALGWYCETNNLIPQMSTIPTKMNFINRDTREPKTIHLDHIVSQYNQEHKKNPGA